MDMIGCTSDAHDLGFSASFAPPCSKPSGADQRRKEQMALMANVDSTDAAANVGSGLQATSPHEQYVGG